MKLYTYIRSLSDCSRLQLAIDRLVSWANKWQLRNSINKCLVCHVGNGSTPPYTCNIQSLPLPNVVTAVKDLGVMFDVKLKFNVHINKIVVKALARSNLIIKCFCLLTQKRFLLVFATYVRPILEYASCLWSHCSLIYIKNFSRSNAASPRG